MSAPRTFSARLTAVLGVAAVATSGWFGVGAASADPLGDARDRAAHLAATVDRLRTEAEVATEHYDALEARLGDAVIRSSLAARQAAAEQARAAAAAQASIDHVRALYESGGGVAMLATVLGGSSPADAVSRLHLASAVLRYDDTQARLRAEASAAAAQHAADADSARADVTRLQVEAAQAADRIQTLLAQQRDALQAATADVRALVEQQQQAAEAASAARFQAAMEAAAAHASDLPPAAAPTAAAQVAIEAARSRLGDPYVWGATGPSTFDCSGLTQWAYARAGVQLPRVAADQWNAGPHVPLSDLAPGDLLFWATDVSEPASIHHVALYIGDGMMIAAPHTGDVVKVQPVYFDGYIGATRPTADPT